MFIECVTVCVDFGDFLATTLPRNRWYFDQCVVVTSPSDIESQSVASKHSCIVVQTNDHKLTPEDKFNRGRAVNAGLRKCSGSEFILVLDSDIVLPGSFRQELESLSKSWKQETIYGMHRRMCESYEDWLSYLSYGRLDVFQLEDKGPPRQRPVGFFQLWKEFGGVAMFYPEDYPTSSDSDLVFRDRFKHFGHFKSECLHLTNERYQHGTDYSGRKSNRWGPCT